MHYVIVFGIHMVHKDKREVRIMKHIYFLLGFSLLFGIGGWTVSAEVKRQTEKFFLIDQFSSKVDFPNEFGHTDSLLWGVKGLSNHPHMKELIPMRAYKLTDACEDNEVQNKVETCGVLIFDLNESSVRLESSLENTCQNLAKSSNGNKISLNGAGDATPSPGVVGATKIANHLTEMTDDQEASQDFILTACRLPNIKAVTEIWLFCNTNILPIAGTICHETLDVSPYRHHKSLIRATRP